MDENAVAQQYGFDVPMDEHDDDFRRVIEESMKTGGPKNIEDDLLRQALEESRKHR